MASVLPKKMTPPEGDDELDSLFSDFDHQFKDLQQKFTDMETELKQFRSKDPDPPEEGNS